HPCSSAMRKRKAGTRRARREPDTGHAFAIVEADGDVFRVHHGVERTPSPLCFISDKCGCAFKMPLHRACCISEAWFPSILLFRSKSSDRWELSLSKDPRKNAAGGTVFGAPHHAREASLHLIYNTAPIGLAFLSPDCPYLQNNKRITEI